LIDARCVLLMDVFLDNRWAYGTRVKMLVACRDLPASVIHCRVHLSLFKSYDLVGVFTAEQPP